MTLWQIFTDPINPSDGTKIAERGGHWKPSTLHFNFEFRTFSLQVGTLNKKSDD
jgi:hypothetical protein